MLPALALALTLAAPAREMRVVMGTTAEVWVKGLADAGPALDAAFACLGRVDDSMSLWKESELTRLNRSGQATISADLLAVLRHALDVAAASGGAFDPTVEPLVRASGGLGGKARRLGGEERRQLLARVGVARVHLDAASGSVRLEPGTALDFGGIAKGYAVDLALAALQSAGAGAGLVDLGTSSIGVFGEPLDIEVRNPDSPGGAPWATFHVRDAHVSTSGGDQKPGHIIDPHTGVPAEGVLSATVVAHTGIEADALSTAVYVLGADAGLALVKRRGAAGVVALREHGRGLVRATPGFSEAYGLEAGPGVRIRE